MKKENKGITLIALVITIIVLLILAAITINLTVGDQGIITRAQQAAIEYAHATLWESMQLQYSNYRLDLNRANGEFLKYLQDKDIIGTELDGGGYIINVKNLLGEKLQIGNGTSGENDVYKITEVTHEGDNNIEYKVEYFGKSGNVELGVLSDKLAQIEAGGEGGDEAQESEAYFDVSKQIVSTPSNGEKESKKFK